MSQDYFKPTQIQSDYNITATTLNKWIRDAQEGRNNLQLVTISDKLRVLDTPNNRSELSQLKNQSQRFRNKVTKKTTKVRQEFYQFFNTNEQIEIYKHLELRNEINLKFFYKSEGAKYCDRYYKSEYNFIKDKVNSLLNVSTKDLLQLVTDQSTVNVIDLGPGNGYPVKHVLDPLIEQGKLGQYISVDISSDINDIAINNIHQWYPEVQTKVYVRDFETDKLGDVFLENSNIKENESNIILFLGSTLNNSDNRVTILKNLANGMLKDDILVATVTIDSGGTRAKKAYIKNEDLLKQSKWLFDIIGIDQIDDNISVDFDPETNKNYKYLKLDKDYQINLSISDQIVSINLTKDTKINFWKHYLLSIDQILDEARQAGLDILTFKKDPSQEVALVVYKLSL